MTLPRSFEILVSVLLTYIIMTKARNRRNKRIRLDAARDNLYKLNADLRDQIECRKAVEAVHPRTEPRIKGVWTRSEVRYVMLQATPTDLKLTNHHQRNHRYK